MIVASNLGSDFIQISTDQIYNGEGPQKENQVKILNNYSRTKIDSENIQISKFDSISPDFSPEIAEKCKGCAKRDARCQK